jgi:predicted ATP-grasp superfamily ATP-dependent carboligase
MDKTNQVSRGRRPRTGRVLVLGTDQRVVLAVVRSLGRQGLTVHLGWSARNSIAARSRYVAHVHELPRYNPVSDLWKQELLAVLRREPFDLVIPCNDSTLVPLIANRSDFAEFPQIYLLPPDVFSTVSDKFNTYRLAQDLGVNVPRGRVIDRSADPDELIQEFGLPLILKPQATITVHNAALANVVRRVGSREDLAEAVAQLGEQPVLVQENFAGRGVGVEMLVQDGEVLVAFQHARIHETMEWGSSYRKSVPLTPHLLEAARTLMRGIGYTGVAMAEFIVDPLTDRWVFLEINGRFWGSLPLAVAAGADFPFYLYQMLVEGERKFPTDYRLGVRCRNLPLDLGWMKSRFSGDGWRKLVAPLQMAAQLSTIALHGDHLDSFSLDDPRPQITELRELAGRAVTKMAGRAGVQSPT